MENQMTTIETKQDLNKIIRRAQRPTHTNFYEGRDLETGNFIITLGVWDIKKFSEAKFSIPSEMYWEVASTLKPRLYHICMQNQGKCEANPNL